jgi:tRNA (guanosine-2'-O-)-methyltransferase
MRRSTEGVVGIADLSDPRVLRASARDPEAAIATLEPLVTEARRARLKEVIARRITSVVVAFDAPYDPHNGAAVMRSCEAFGIQSFHVVQQEHLGFAAARSVARGAEKWIDLTCHPTAASFLRFAKDGNFTLVAAHPAGELAPDELGALPKVAIVLGSERQGIRKELARECAHGVRVPMKGFAESLNVSVTAAILIHSATRNRSGDIDVRTQRLLYARGLCLSVPHAAKLLGEA